MVLKPIVSSKSVRDLLFRMIVRNVLRLVLAILLKPVLGTDILALVRLFETAGSCRGKTGVVCQPGRGSCASVCNEGQGVCAEMWWPCLETIAERAAAGNGNACGCDRG